MHFHWKLSWFIFQEEIKTLQRRNAFAFSDVFEIKVLGAVIGKFLPSYAYVTNRQIMQQQSTV